MLQNIPTERLEIYNLLSDLTDLIIEQYNPCHKEGDKCSNKIPYFCCTRTRFKRKDLTDDRCLYLDNGCLNPNLRCKLFLCRTVLDSIDKDCLSLFKAIETMGIIYGFVEHPFLGERYAGIDNG